MPATKILSADRVLETSTDTGTGTTFDLAGAVAGYQTFVAGIGDGNRCLYCIQAVDGNNVPTGEWEIGCTTVDDATPDTLTRDEVIFSSNANALVDFAAGTKRVFCPVTADSLLPARNLLINGTGRFAQRGTQLGASPTGTTAGPNTIVTSVSSLLGIRANQLAIAGSGANSNINSIDNATQITLSSSTDIGTGATFYCVQRNDTYCADRWYGLCQTATFGYRYDRSTGDNDDYAIKLSHISSSTAQRFGVAQIVEAAQSKLLRSRRVRFQGRMKCSANQAIRYAIVEWNGTADAVTSDIVNNWASTNYTAGFFFIANTTITTGSITPAAATWTDFAIKATLGASVNNIIVFVWTEGTAAQNVSLEIECCQLTEGWVPREWRPRSPVEEELLCLPFCEKNVPHDFVPTHAQGYAQGYAQGSAAGGGNYLSGGWNFRAEKRATPTVTFWNPNDYSGQIHNLITATNFTSTAASVIGRGRVFFYGVAPASSNPGQLCTIVALAEAEL